MRESKALNLNNYLLREKKSVFFAGVLTILSVCVQTLQATSLAALANSMLTFSLRPIISAILIFALIYISVYLIDGLATYLQTLSIQKMNIDIQTDLLWGIANLGYDRFHHEGTIGKFVSWLNNDIDNIDELGFNNIFGQVTNISGIVVPLISLFSYHWLLGSVVLGYAILGVGLPKIVSKLIDKPTKRLTVENESFATRVEDTLNGYDTYSAYHRQQEIQNNIANDAARLGKVNVHYQRQLIKANGVMTYSAIIGQYLIYLMTGILILNNQLSVGSFLATGSLAGMVFTCFSQFFNNFTQSKTTAIIFEKYQNLSLERQAVLEFVKNSEARLKLTKVASGENNRWLAPTSAKIGNREKVKLSGPSGSGKSTLLRSLAALSDNYEGEIEWSPTRPDVLYLPQKPVLFNQTIRFNLSLNRHFSDDQLWQALDQVFLTDKIKKFPQGLDQVINISDSQFSGGEQQRLAVARGLLIQASVVLLDEATSNVDSRRAEKILATFLESSDALVICTSHSSYPDLAGLYTQTIEIGQDNHMEEADPV
ncbi:ABC transporter transmembrane domain-containing protein [Lapidilactobacillus luobeiensis]|uniref:ABC transporter transmembrane domain-containing protein n=1 Tax=Lapidilactobacillus luobeiensis TaxID=2950371 RepID=UPI0021C43433|nr:ABC transporter ATP-binding protein [Lapidilactobacillus luobeiensis]